MNGDYEFTSREQYLAARQEATHEFGYGDLRLAREVNDEFLASLRLELCDEGQLKWLVEFAGKELAERARWGIIDEE
ncbi:hypothetical protein [Desulfarculus baarsii]